MSEPKQVGHYTLERELGRGAMGVVYLARDDRLGRLVAVKALFSELARDETRRARFEREARTLAALNHPNIAAIYGVESIDEVTYLILELAEGPTLHDRLHTPEASPIVLPEALEICAQVAAAVGAAHKGGVVHRDLKPENIKVRPDGVVKVLDFGIATWVEKKPAPSADATTIATASTHDGSMIGTPSYMSPEQARGQLVGPATDVWSFGCILYECLTTRRAFPGNTVADAVAATLMADPDWKLIPPQAPRGLLDLLRACLEKDPQKRPEDMAQVRAELERSKLELSLGPAGAHAAPVPAPPPIAVDAPAGPGEEPIGRAKDLVAIQNLLATFRRVTIIGPPGIGKSHVAGYASSLGAAKSEATLVRIAGAPGVGPGYLDAALALALRVPIPEGQTPAARAAWALSSKPALLLIDDADFARDDCELLTETLLRECPLVHIVLVAREPIGLAGESVYAIGPLAAPDPTKQGGPFDAGNLFIRRATATGRFKAGRENAQAVAMLARRLEGHPLAIELAAARLRSLTFEQLNAALEQRLRITSRTSTQSPLDAALSQVLQWSFDQLRLVERAVLQRLSVFAGGISLHAAVAMCGDRQKIGEAMSRIVTGTGRLPGAASVQTSEMAAILAALADAGFVSTEGGTGTGTTGLRYRLVESVREFARAQLESGPEFAPAAQRHAECFAVLAEQVGAATGASARQSLMRACRGEFANLRAAEAYLKERQAESAMRRAVSDAIGATLAHG